MLDAVIFDMDGVLIDSEPLHYKSDIILFKELNIHVNNNYLDQFVGMTNPEMWKLICKEYNISTNINCIPAFNDEVQQKPLLVF